MHKSYSERLKHPADFRVKYRFYSEEEGGRRSTPFQGYRSDFWYPYENHVPNSQYMIWPEFEDEAGKVINENDKSVSSNGTARMWIVMPKMREYHRDKIIVGIKGYFMEGPKRVADCEVIEIIGLNVNPTE